jgi:hypothetical protein
VQFRSLVVRLQQFQVPSGVIPPGAPHWGDVMRGKYEFPGIKKYMASRSKTCDFSANYPRRSKQIRELSRFSDVVVLASISLRI